MPKFLEVSDTAAARGALGASARLEYNVVDYGAAGDGVTNDGTAIGSAVAAAKAAGGGVVFFPQGTYLVSAAIVVDGANITLQGAGRSATIIKTVGNHQIIRGVSVAGLQVRDLQVLGDADSGKTSQRGIEWTGVSDGLIHNVWAKNLGYDGILLLSGCVNCTVSNCRVTGCKDDGINIGGDPVAESSGNNVVGNVVSDCASTGIHISDRSRYSSVVGNTISGCNNGIDTYNAGAYGGYGNNSIVGNTIRNSTTIGIYIFNSSRNTVSGNNIDGATNGIYLVTASHCSVTGNVVTNCSNVGIRPNSISTDIVVTGNKLDGATTGIIMESARSVCSENSIRGVVDSLKLTATATQGIIANNLITNGTGNDIEIQAANCSVTGNRIESVGTRGIKVSGGATKCSVTSNFVVGAQAGIEVSPADCLVAGNYLTGQTSSGIYCPASTATHIVGNRFTATQVAVNLFATTNVYLADNYSTATIGTNSVTENNTSTGTILANNRLDKAALLLGTTPVQISLTPTTAYTATNVTTDRAFDANATTTEELADVLGTLIADLKTKGLIA